MYVYDGNYGGENWMCGNYNGEKWQAQVGVEIYSGCNCPGKLDLEPSWLVKVSDNNILITYSKIPYSDQNQKFFKSSQKAVMCPI